ncbi:MAG: alpha/beta hydrolase [Bacteroidetes bacterium]|nr:alpha/beta hydrolase [Bacteroidota bacterium]
MKIALLLFCSLLTLPAMGQKAKTTNAIPFAIGETVSLYSNILEEERKLNIYLPQGYDPESLKEYPVIYLLDGSADEDFIHIAGLVQFGSFSWINMIPETIVVGIANVDRKRDFTFPTTNKKDKLDFPTTGASESFIQFIEKELQPFITENYLVSQERTLIGQSLGGLLGAEILYKYPDLFSKYIIVSPSMWWDDESLLGLTPRQAKNTKNIYVAVGSEGPTMETGAIKLRYALTKAYKDNGNVYFKFLESQDHGDALHLAVYDAFEKLFSVKKPNRTNEED